MYFTDGTYQEFIEKLYSSDNVSISEFRNIIAPEEDFDKRIKEALSIWKESYDVLCAPDSFNSFIKDSTKTYLNYEFNNQIKPIKAHRAIPKVRLVENKNVVVDFKIENKNDVAYSIDSSFQSEFSKCIFIDNPFVIDSLDDRIGYNDSRANKTKKSVISNISIESHERKLISLLHNENNNYFEVVEKNNRLKAVFEKINSIVPGEFYESSEGVFYVDDGAKLSVRNLATGSKMFSIIKILLHSGFVDEKTIIVLDEPESHLHPEWINKFAEILVLLINEIKVKILLTTHSPNLMLALNYYSQKSDISDNAHFYMAERKDYYSKLKCIDNNIGEGYSHLSLPLIEMNLMMNALDEGENGNR